MKSIRRSFMYVFATICGLALGSNALLAADEMMAKGMVKGNLVVSGDVEVNLNTETRNMKSSSGMKSTANSQAGRGKLKFEAKADMGDLYVGGEGAIEAKQDGSVGGGDYFFKVGGPAWNITMGRKGGEGLYTAGQDIAVPNVSSHDDEDLKSKYGVGRYAVDKASQAAVGGANLTFTPNDSLKMQIRIQSGTVDGKNQVGFRPWVELKFGGIGITAAYETLSATAQKSGDPAGKSFSGFGLKMTGDVGAVSLGLNYTSGKEEGAETMNSAGGYLNITMFAGKLGVGHHQNTQAKMTQTDSFISYVIDPLVVDGSKVSVGYGVSNAKKDTAGLFRIRFNYAF